MKNKLKVILLLVVAGLFSMSVFAQEVDLKASEFKWKADKKIGDGHYGTIPLVSAKADIKEGKIKSGEFVLDVKNFEVTDLKGEWKTKFLKHVRSGDFFLAEKYPTAKLVIKEQVGDNKVKGELTIKDKTNPVTIEFKKDKKAYTGTFKFDRTKWDINYGSGSIYETLKVDKIIEDDVVLDFKVVLK